MDPPRIPTLRTNDFTLGFPNAIRNYDLAATDGGNCTPEVTMIPEWFPSGIAMGFLDQVDDAAGQAGAIRLLILQSQVLSAAGSCPL
jgi:hypothetical protein